METLYIILGFFVFLMVTDIVFASAIREHMVKENYPEDFRKEITMVSPSNLILNLVWAVLLATIGFFTIPLYYATLWVMRRFARMVHVHMPAYIEKQILRYQCKLAFEKDAKEKAALEQQIKKYEESLEMLRGLPLDNNSWTPRSYRVAWFGAMCACAAFQAMLLIQTTTGG